MAKSLGWHIGVTEVSPSKRIAIQFSTTFTAFTVPVRRTPALVMTRMPLDNAFASSGEDFIGYLLCCGPGAQVVLSLL